MESGIYKILDRKRERKKGRKKNEIMTQEIKGITRQGE